MHPVFIQQHLSLKGGYPERDGHSTDGHKENLVSNINQSWKGPFIVNPLLFWVTDLAGKKHVNYINIKFAKKLHKSQI